jgi:undecaprenyl-diphosphatase
MRYRQFVPYSVLGTGMWAAAFTLIGYFASQSIDRAAELAGRGTFLLAVTIAVIAGVVWLVRRLRVAKNRERAVATMEANRALRPLVAAGRAVRPEARFIWGRITPGGLGLEFTALIAALAVSLYVLIAYTTIVSADPGPTGADHAAANVAEQLRATGLNEVVKAFTHLGSAEVVLPLALLVAVMLGIERRWADVGVLVAAMLIIVVATDVMKDQVGRPRPAGGLVSYGNQAFPSAHASYSTIYAALAVAIVVRLRPGLTNATAIVLFGIALTVAVGLSRVYLGVHYLSDVSAGWALGVAAFSGCAAVAVVVPHLRQNWRRGDRPREDRA